MIGNIPEERTDESLVQAIRNGDEQSAAELYDRYARRVFALVHAQMADWLHSVTAPEDIVQSVFKSMFRGVQGGSYEAPEGNTLWSLIAVIAVRKIRRRATHHLAECRDAQRNVPIDSLEETQIPAAENFQLLEMDLREMLGSLRDADRKILLARIQGHSVDEIGEMMGRSSRTIERSLQRIRELLADLLSDELHEP